MDNAARHTLLNTAGSVGNMKSNTPLVDVGTDDDLAAMDKVQPFCRSGLGTNILRPFCGVLSDKLCHHCLQSLSHLIKRSS